MKVLVTGGAGFVGANVCVALADRHPEWKLVALDNLRRRGSELNLPRLRGAGVRFVHGDVRDRDDLAAVGAVEAVVEASAEPSALAGLDGGLEYLVGTNLLGALHCLELCRQHDAQLVFLSTSRVYPVATLRALRYGEGATRFELEETQDAPGASAVGISEAFPLGGARTFYGATKLAAELLLAEHVDAFGVRATVNRCGVIAGPWQMGKVDQGVVAYWVLAHHFGRPLRYIGFGGEGKQVRDLLSVLDLVDLLERQLREPAAWAGTVFNVGGGPDNSLSLRELTGLCQAITGRHVAIASEAATRPGDVPIYVSDCSALFAHTDWRPSTAAGAILEDIARWIETHEGALRNALDVSPTGT